MSNNQRRVVLVTGAGGLLGRAITKRMKQTGALLYLGHQGDQPRAELKALEDESARCVQLNVTSETSVDSAVSTIVAAHGPIDVLVYAAGLMFHRPLRYCTQADVERMFAVNVFGAIYCAKAVIPDMSRAGWGRIVWIGSRAATAGVVSSSLYTATKAALSGLCRSTSKEYASLGITANVVSPAKLEDGQESNAPPKSSYPMGRFIDPSEVAEAVAFLASDAASAITGQTLEIDGACTL
jgi:3-oxoacyl-[acyl-carrier protein] reductase